MSAAASATAAALRALADKAVRRAGFGIGMTELMPDDVRLLQRAAKLLEPPPGAPSIQGRGDRLFSSEARTRVDAFAKSPDGVAALQVHHDQLLALPRPATPEPMA